MNDSYDAVVLGGGFKGMMTAYGLRQQGMSVCIIEKGRQLGGFMSPMSWNGTDIDKGPQYLDGIAESHKHILDDIMGDHEPLASLDFSYASYWNSTWTDGFALPDYRSLPMDQRATVLYETLNHNQPVSAADTIADLYDDSQGKSFDYINGWCHKFLRRDASELSPLNRGIVTFFGRKLLLDDELSLQLKQHPILDNLLAANKKSISHGTYNLYPLGRNLGYFRTAFDEKLREMGVDVVTDSSIDDVSSIDDSLQVSVGAEIISTDRLYCTATLEVTEDMLLGTSRMVDHIAPVAQVFYLVETDTVPEMPFYVMNYSDSAVSRITNFSAYANRSHDDRSILCIEAPTEIGSQTWQDPEQQYPDIIREAAAMGIDTDSITSHQAFKVPSTYRATLRGYEDGLASVEDALTSKFGDRVVLPTPHLLTRASIMHDLTEIGVLS